MKYKPGVKGDLFCREMVNVLPKIQAAYDNHGVPEKCVCTSANDGTHKAGSLHYVNQAGDWRLPDWGGRKDLNKRHEVLLALKALTGKTFDVVLEKDHYHIEYDPK